MNFFLARETIEINSEFSHKDLWRIMKIQCYSLKEEKLNCQADCINWKLEKVIKKC